MSAADYEYTNNVEVIRRVVENFISTAASRLINCLPLIEIPHSTTYQGQVQWAYHPVYELNGVVYSVELPYKWMYFKDYIKLMRRLNANNIVHNTEKQRENNKSSKA